jgi:hypothetical protein
MLFTQNRNRHFMPYQQRNTLHNRRTTMPQIDDSLAGHVRTPASSLRTTGSVAALVIALLGADVALRTVHAAQNPVPPKLITAQEFRLVDKDGATRASIALQPDGSPYIALTDKANNRRISMRVRPDGGSTFAMNDADGKNRIALDTQADGSASVSVTNRQGKGGAGLLVSTDGSPIVVVRDKDGSVAFAEPQPQPADDPNDAGKKPDPPKK